MNYFFLGNFYNRSTANACPDCRAYITGPKRLFLNLSNDVAVADEPISDTALAATIDGLTAKILRYEDEITQLGEDFFNAQTTIFVLSMQNDQKKVQLKQLEKAGRERNLKLTALRKKLQGLEANVEAEMVRSRILNAKLVERDRIIRDLNGTLKSMETKYTKKVKLNQTENSELNKKWSRLNNCIDMLDVRTQVDKVMNRRITRSQTRQSGRQSGGICKTEKINEN